jgi:hypothetical protein
MGHIAQISFHARSEDHCKYALLWRSLPIRSAFSFTSCSNDCVRVLSVEFSSNRSCQMSKSTSTWIACCGRHRPLPEEHGACTQQETAWSQPIVPYAHSQLAIICAPSLIIKVEVRFEGSQHYYSNNGKTIGMHHFGSLQGQLASCSHTRLSCL